jgi:hypothetical protein
MKNTIGSTIAIISCLFLLQACDSTTYRPAPPTIAPSPLSTTTPNVESNLTLKEIIGNEAKPDQRQTLNDAVINTIQWKMSDEKIISAKKDAIVWSTSFGKNGIAVVEVPNTTIPWYNFVLLNNKNDSGWTLTGVIDMPISKSQYDEKYGLDLPMDHFSATKLSSSESESYFTWAFANEDKYVVVGKYPREALGNPEGAVESIINDRKTVIKTEDKNILLFYFDKEYLIWIIGNITDDEMKKLAIIGPILKIH